MIEPKEYKNKQGVYMIVQPDGKYYIGSSIELYNRLGQN
jgi:predicted GIY-YIG superfamily endonuclease